FPTAGSPGGAGRRRQVPDGGSSALVKRPSGWKAGAEGGLLYCRAYMLLGKGEGMSPRIAGVTAGNPTTWLERTRALGPAIDASAAANEQATELAPDVVAAIDEAGLFDIMVPRDLGGAEAHPEEVIDAIGELSYWDGSAGWYSHAVMTGGAVA